MKRPIPAVPMPLSWADVWGACAAGPKASVQFEEACRQYHGAVRVFGTSSGSAAMWVALKALARRSPDRTQVVIPAYTCPLVGRVVMEAGLTGRCVDISLEDFNLDPDQVTGCLSDRTLAVVAPHMFGTPCDVKRLEEVCREAGTILVEDLAHACGAAYDGRRVGTFGSLAFLSLGRSKNPRGYLGGALIVNDADLVPYIGEELGRLAPGGGLGLSAVGTQLAVCVLSRPRPWQMLKRVPGLRIGTEDEQFHEKQFSALPAWQSGLGLISLQRVDEYNRRRAHLADIVEQELADARGVRLQCRSAPRQSANLRVAMLLSCSREERDAVVSQLQAQGIDARAFYSRTVPEFGWWQPVPEQTRCTVAEQVVASNLVLPLYFGSREADAVQMARALKNALPPRPG